MIDAAYVERSGFPAHAGMDRSATSSRSDAGRFPRPRGDGPRRRWPRARLSSVSPPTRGWTAVTGRHPVEVCGFPAHAGMDLRAHRRACRSSRFPRPRGDGPRGPTPTATSTQVSPPTRGWTLEGLRNLRGCVGFPAHAGMDPPRRRRSELRSRFPRPRGDGPYEWLLIADLDKVSPPTRGWTADRAGRQHRALGTRQSITSCKCQHSRSRSIASRPSARVRRTWRHGGRLDRVGRDAGLDQPQGLPLPAGNVRPLGALRAA